MESFIEKQLSNQSSLRPESTSGDSIASNLTEPNEIKYEYDNDVHSRCKFHYEEMKKERNRVQEEKVDLAFEINEKNKIIEATLQDSLKKDQENICLKKVNDELKATNAELLEKISDFTRQLESEQKKNNGLLKIVAEMKDDYEREMVQHSKIKIELEKENECSKSKIDQKQNEFVMLQSNYFELSNDYHESIIQKDGLRAEVNELQTELTEFRTNNKEQKLKIDKLEHELQALKQNWNKVAMFFAPNDTNPSNQIIEELQIEETMPLHSQPKSAINIASDIDAENPSSLVFETTIANPNSSAVNGEASHVSSSLNSELQHNKADHTFIVTSEVEVPHVNEEGSDVSISADDNQSGVNSHQYELRKKRPVTDICSSLCPEAKRPARIKNELESEEDDKSDDTVEEEEEIDCKEFSLTTTQTPQTNSKKPPYVIHRYYKFEFRDGCKHSKVVTFASCGKCYIFNFSQATPKSAIYYCANCKRLKHSLNGHFETEADGKQCFIIKKVHICEPIAYESLRNRGTKAHGS